MLNLWCAVLCLVIQLCPTLCNPTDYNTPGSSGHGDSLGKKTGVSCHALLPRIFPTQGSNPGLLHCRWILYHLSQQGFMILLLLLLSCFSHVWLCNPMDCSLPGFSVHGVFQARILKWVAIPFSRRSSQPGHQTQVLHTAGRFFMVQATREALTPIQWIVLVINNTSIYLLFLNNISIKEEMLIYSVL